MEIGVRLLHLRRHRTIVRVFCLFTCNLSIVRVAKMSATLCGVSKHIFVASRGSVALLIATMKWATVSVPFSACTEKSGRLPSRVIVSTTLIGNLKNALATWCLIHPQ